MDREIEHMKEMINKARISGEAELIANREYLQRIVNYLDTLNRENSRIRELCDKYEEEHNTTFDIWKEAIARLNKADNQITIIKQIIKEQPTRCIEEDEWLEERLTGIQTILRGCDGE